jgi:hypothetical protein
MVDETVTGAKPIPPGPEPTDLEPQAAPVPKIPAKPQAKSPELLQAERKPARREDDGGPRFNLLDPDSGAAEDDQDDASGADDDDAGTEREAGVEGASPDEDETEGKDTDTDEQPVKGKLTRHQRARRATLRAVERAERAEAELAALRRGGQQPDPNAAPGQQQQRDPNAGQVDWDPEPKVDDYKETLDPAAFHKLAHDAWRARVGQRAQEASRGQTAEQTQAQQRQREAFLELAEAHQEREEVVRKVITDYDEVIEDSDAEVAPHVQQLILDSDKSPLLAYHLCSNERELLKLNRMSPTQAAREIGKLESRLSLPKPKKQSSAPKPLIVPKGGAGGRETNIAKLAESEDATAYANARDASDRARRNARGGQQRRA